jgi:type IV secretion system protein VirB10
VSTGSATYTLLEGTVIEAVLTNRLDGSYAGPVNAMVTAPVYSRDVQHLLIPRGSRLLGQATPVTQFGQQRLAVAFHRLVFADGHFVSLERYQALDQVGETGLRDKVDNHYLQTFGAALAVGALAGFAQHDTRVGLDESAGDTYRQGMSSSVTQSSMRILDRFLNRLPTITIREGHRIKVYLSADFSLPEYQELRPNSAPR